MLLRANETIDAVGADGRSVVFTVDYFAFCDLIWSPLTLSEGSVNGSVL